MPEPGWYLDLFVRDNFGDTGWQPVADSYVSGSPDIIPYNGQLLTPQQLIGTYNGPLLDIPLQNYQVNRVYVRAKNNYKGASAGQIFLYYSTGNLLVNISTWRNNRITNAGGTWGSNIAAQQKDQICPGDQPFLFTPSPSLGSHFCLLAQVCTAMHPNPLPTTDFSGWQAFVDWVRWNANIAWHNVDIVNTLPPQGYIGSLVFQNLNPSSQFYGFAAVYSKMPPHSILRVWADPVPAAGFQGFDTTAKEINDGAGQLGAGQFFPPLFQTTINCTCQFPGSPVKPPPDTKITLESMGTLTNPEAPENKKYASFMFEPAKLGLTTQTHGVPADSMFVPITSFNVAFNPTDQFGAFLRSKRS